VNDRQGSSQVQMQTRLRQQSECPTEHDGVEFTDYSTVQYSGSKQIILASFEK